MKAGRLSPEISQGNRSREDDGACGACGAAAAGHYTAQRRRPCWQETVQPGTRLQEDDGSVQVYRPAEKVKELQRASGQRRAAVGSGGWRLKPPARPAAHAGTPLPARAAARPRRRTDVPTAQRAPPQHTYLLHLAGAPHEGPAAEVYKVPKQAARGGRRRPRRQVHADEGGAHLGHAKAQGHALWVGCRGGAGGGDHRRRAAESLGRGARRERGRQHPRSAVPAARPAGQARAPARSATGRPGPC